MNPYYFVGHHAEIGGVPLRSFGQEIELAEDVARDAMKKLPLLTKDQWEQVQAEKPDDQQTAALMLAHENAYPKG